MKQGSLIEYKKAAHENTKALIAENAGKVTEAMEEMKAKMLEDESAFEEQRAANKEAMKQKFDKFLGALKEGFTPMTIELVAGKGTDADGSLIEGNAFELSMSARVLTIRIKVRNRSNILQRAPKKRFSL